jgi:hypothetical protein
MELCMISVTTWTSHDCGCETSDTGWMIFTSRCAAHFGLVPEREREQMRVYKFTVQYGPWSPYECAA